MSTPDPDPTTHHTAHPVPCPPIGPQRPTFGPPRIIEYPLAAPDAIAGSVGVRRPAAILPVLVCLPRIGRDLPEASAVKDALIEVLGRADPDGAGYRTGASTLHLLHHHLDPPTHAEAPVLVRAPGQEPPACLGGSLAWLAPPPPHTPAGHLVRVITDAGVWLGFMPGRDHPGTADVSPPPVSYLDRLPGDAVIIAIEATVPLGHRDRT